MSDFLKQLDNLINAAKGISGASRTFAKISTIDKIDGLRVGEPGNISFHHSNSELYRIVAPVSYSVWYLYNQKNFFDELGIDANDPTEYIETNLKFLFEEVTDESEGLTGINFLQIPETITKSCPTPSWQSGLHPNDDIEFFSAFGPSYLNKMAYEVWLYGASIMYSTDKNVTDYVGYLAIPIGQLGAMEVISLIRETDIHPGDDEQPIALQESEVELFPPRKYKPCFGRQLIVEGYHPKEAEADHIEYPADPYPSGIYCESDILPKHWLRFYIHKDDTFPIPGEFVGVLVRPHSAPPHPWWFQRSSPLLYSGHWFETNHLTSGIITEVIEEEDRDDMEDPVGDLYTATFQGYSLQFETSDFYEYEVDDRVAIIKKDNTTDISIADAFTWNDISLVQKSKGDAGGILTDYVIVPLSFY